MNDQVNENNKQQYTRKHISRQFLRGSPARLWPSAKKYQHSNPGGVRGVNRRSIFKTRERSEVSEAEMNLRYEQLARRPLGSMCASTGPTFQVYSHATDPLRTGISEVCVSNEMTAQPLAVNGVDSHAHEVSPHDTPAHVHIHEIPTSLDSPGPDSPRPHSPATPHSPASPLSPIESLPPSPPLIPPSLPQSIAQVMTPTGDNVITPLYLKRKRKAAEDTGSTPPPSKKRLNLSLNRSRSHTPSCYSVCSSGGTSPSPSSFAGSSTSTNGSSDQRQESVSSTPPLSPSTAIAHESTPLRTDSMLPESPLGVMMEHQGSTKVAERASPQPSTSRQALSMANDDPLDVTPLVHDQGDDTLTDEYTEEGEAVKCDPPKDEFHDISSWGEGRLVYGCDIPHASPFDKFSQGHLENFAEMVSKGGDLENYLHTAERLINLGCFFPTAKLEEVFRLMWRCNSPYAIKKMHFFLQQDIALRTDTNMKSPHFLLRLQKCINAIKTNSKVLVASVLLSYLLKFLIKNLDDNKLDPKASLIEQQLSSKNMLNITKILDAVFCHQERAVSPVAGVHCPIQSLLTMLCLPLLTCDPSSRADLRTKLAREVAMRLDHLHPHSLQYQLITNIPSNYLKEKVLDLVLERNFALSPQTADVARTFDDNSVSFAKIASVHLHRNAHHPNGASHSLSFFLQLLTALIRAHIVSESGSQPLVSLVPSSPPQPLPNEFTTSIVRNDEQLRQNLLDLHAGVLRLTERLSQDNQHFIELTEPTTWFHLQLLSLITSTM